jgi:ABC-type microcin C transport system permease subunit YejE
MTAQIPKFLTDRLWYGHLLAATVGAMSVGFIPAAMMERWTLNTHLDTIGFPIPPVALVLGYILARKYPCSAAIWVWVPPLRGLTSRDGKMFTTTCLESPLLAQTASA